MTHGDFRRVVLWAAFTSAAFAASQADDFYDAIRANNLDRLATLIKTESPNQADSRGITPLMYSATVGSVEAMRLLIDHGADVNARNAFGSTALMWSATDIGKVRLLVDRGADVNLASKAGRTALLVAARSNPSAEIVRYLIAHGADVKAADATHGNALFAATLGNDTESIRLLIAAGVDVNAPGDSNMTPLMIAAANAEAVKMLLAKGAKVNAVSADTLGSVKNGPIGLGRFTALQLASTGQSVEAVKLLLDAGAGIDTPDIRGMTPLMLAIGTDHVNRAVVDLLLARGADPNLKSRAGETALDWARKFGRRPVIDALARVHAQETARTPASISPFAPVALRPSVERALPLLEKTSGTFFQTGGCAACHHQNITDIAAGIARTRGVHVDETAAAERQKLNAAFFGAAGPALLERLDTPGSPDLPLYALAGMAAAGYPPDRMTDNLISNVVAQQWSDGRWNVYFSRPPIEDGDIFRTALGIRAIAVYGPPGRSAEMQRRIAMAKTWLTNARVETAEDRNMQLLGLHWAGADTKTQSALAQQIRAQQRSDGGWAQRDELSSDAYATGQTLYTLAYAAAHSTKDPVYQHGVNFLLSTQHADGSWYVASRSPKFQPYFESGSPYGHDQWISSMATGWATAALAYAIEPPAGTKVAE
jgi:ankyrin repeat protein